MGRRLTFGVILLLVLLAVTPLGASGPGDALPSIAQPEVDNTITRIQLYENGSARWSIQVRTRLETDEEVEQFEQFRDRIRQNKSVVLESFRDRMTGVVQTAANNTGRPMAARNFAVSTRIQEVPQRWGIVEYEFTWSGFAVSENNTLVVGDLFEGGFFLSEEDRLIIAPPTGYRIANSTPNPDSIQNEAYTWTGRQDFSDSRPAVIVEPIPETTSTEVDLLTTGQGTEQATEENRLVPISLRKWPEILLVLAVVLLILLGRRRGLGVLRWEDDTEKANQSESLANGIVTNEDQIRSLLADHDGEMRQSAIAERLDWSASKTSRVLSEMAKSGEIEQLRIGRQNVIKMAEHEEE